MALERIIKLLEKGKLSEEQLKAVLLKEAAMLTLFEKKAHDLNNILAPVIAYPELAISQLPKDSPVIEYLETIKAAGERSADELNDIMTLARRGNFRRINLCCNDIVYAFVGSSTYNAMHEKKPEVDLGVSTHDDLYDIKGDEKALYHVIMNLVSNSFDAIREEGKVIISTENSVIDQDISTRYGAIPAGAYAILGVEDDGEGVPEENLDNIFEMHFSTRDGQNAFGGHGLGLPIVRDIMVDDHNGYINLISKKGEGAKFEVYLPAVTD